MAKEADQTRWVGVRPTDPSEDIPTTTKKVLPAVSDLQAVKDRYRVGSAQNGVNCSVLRTVFMVGVPAGEIWVITSVTMVNKTSMCDMVLNARIAIGDNMVCGWYSIPPNIIKNWNGLMVLAEGDRISFLFSLGGVTDDIEGWVRGYKVGVYA